MTMASSRAEHLQWAKERALEYADRGEVANTINSMTSDLSKHPETRGNPRVLQMTQLAAEGQFDQPGELRRFIEGFN
jgi:hypothetical protein